MAPIKGSKKSGGKGGAGQKAQTRRLMLVRTGQASRIPTKLYSVEEAFRVAGLPS